MVMKRYMLVEMAEMLKEQDLVVDRKSKLILSIEIDQSRTGDCYFKVYLGSDLSKKARVLFKRAEYVAHNDGTDGLRLDREHRIRLNELIRMPALTFIKPSKESQLKNDVLNVFGSFDGFLVWHYLICKFNYAVGLSNYVDTLTNNLKGNPKYVPINTNITDYNIILTKDERINAEKHNAALQSNKKREGMTI